MKISLAASAAFAPAVQPRGTGTSTASSAPLSKQDEIAARKLQQAKDAVATLAAVKTKTKDDQKARAAQKVKELKARLQALRMLYANDPKKLAKAAAQIARELAGAVKNYTSAGGSASELDGTDAGATSADATAPAADATTEGVGGEAPNPATPDASAKDETSSDGGADKPATAAPGATKEADDKSTAETARDKADEEFKNEARDLARALKAALRRKDPKHRDDEDRRSGEQALAAVDQAVGALPIAEMAAAAAIQLS